MKTLSIIIAVLICSIYSSKSQTYSFQTSNATYTALFNPVSLNNGEVWEMADFIIPIGFDFWFFNSSIDTLYFFESAPAMLSSSNEEGGFHKLLIPFGASLVDRGLLTGHSLSPLSYQLSGEPGSRILKIEWKNVGFAFEFYNNNTLNDYTNFQLWLYETSGNIEIYHGPTSVLHPELAYADESGPSTALIPKYDYEADTISSKSLWLLGNPTNPMMVETDNFIFLDGTIPPNTVYQFNNLSVANDSKPAVISAIYPNPVMDILNIRLKAAHNLPATALICDMTGRKVYNASINQNQGEIQIPVSNLNTGIYQLIIKQGQETYTSRFVKL